MKLSDNCGECQFCPELVAVNDHVKASSANRRKAFRNGQTQTAALGGTGLVTSCEPFLYLVGGKVQLICGRVLNGSLNKTVGYLRFNENSCAL